MKVTSTQRFGKVQFDLAFEMDAPEEMKPLLVSALESLKTDVAAKAKKQFAADIDVKPADYQTELMDDPEEAEKVFKPLFAAKNIVASNFRDWAPSTNNAAIGIITLLTKAGALTEEWAKLTPAEILAKL